MKRRSRCLGYTRADSRTITFRTTPRELADLEIQAARAGLSVGQLARAAALGPAATAVPTFRRRPPVDAAELRQIAGSLGKIGSNLNQLVRAANTRELAHLRHEGRRRLAEVQQVVNALLNLTTPDDPDGAP